MKLLNGSLIFLVALMPLAATGQNTVSFQNGVNGYSGTVDIYIGLSAAVNGPESNVIGSMVEDVFIDGRYNTSDDSQALIRFDGILSEIPAGATILNAELEFTTSEVNNSPSGGPYGIGQLLQAFDETTTWVASGGNGFRFADGESNRPLANGYTGKDAGTTVVAPVTEIVQNWVDGDANHGFVITAGTTNGWSVLTTGFQADPAFRPKLTIEYSMDKPMKLEMGSIVQSVDDPATSMFIVEVFNDLFINADDILSGNDFIDGPPGGAADNTDALLRFDSIFVSDGGIVPDEAQIVKAELCVTTATSDFSLNSGTVGEYAVREITNDWDEMSSYFDLTFGPFVDGEAALIADAVAIYDVTVIIEGYQNGNPNFGMDVATTETTDGWGILLPTSIAPPELKVYWVAGDFLLGDVNCDGLVNLLDVQPFVDLISNGDFNEKADITGDGMVNLLDVGPFVALLSGA